MEMELYFKFFNTRLFEKGIVCSSRKGRPYSEKPIHVGYLEAEKGNLNRKKYRKRGKYTKQEKAHGEMLNMKVKVQTV